MLAQHVLHAMDTQTIAFGAGKQDLPVAALSLPQPGGQDSLRGFGQRCTALLAAFGTRMPSDEYRNELKKFGLIGSTLSKSLSCQFRLQPLQVQTPARSATTCVQPRWWCAKTRTTLA